MELTKILLVAEHDEISTLSELFLFAIDEQYQISKVSEMEKACELITEQQFDCYIFAATFHHHYGLELFFELSATPYFQHHDISPPVIILFNNSNHVDINQALDSGVSDCLMVENLTGFRLRQAITRARENYLLKVEFEKQQDELEKMHFELLKKNKEIQAFYFTVSHELKTPLTSSREFIALIRDGIVGDVNEEQIKLLNYAIEGCDQLNRCVNDLLDATRLDTGKFTIEPKHADLNQMIDKVTRSKLSCAEKKNINIIKRVNNNIPKAFIDKQRIAQVLTNLLDNAIKFTPHKGTISITARHDEENNDISISVSDTGRGIPADKLPYIFDRLYQVSEDDTNKEHGLGLGLNICREIIHLHNGEIFVDSTLNEGSTFNIRLPL